MKKAKALETLLFCDKNIRSQHRYYYQKEQQHEHDKPRLQFPIAIHLFSRKYFVVSIAK